MPASIRSSIGLLLSARWRRSCWRTSAGNVYLLETEYLGESGGWERLDQAAPTIQDWPGATAKLEAAVKAMHACCGQEGVHGDLRAPNIMVR